MFDHHNIRCKYKKKVTSHFYSFQNSCMRKLDQYLYEWRSLEFLGLPDSTEKTAPCRSLIAMIKAVVCIKLYTHILHPNIGGRTEKRKGFAEPSERSLKTHNARLQNVLSGSSTSLPIMRSFALLNTCR